MRRALRHPPGRLLSSNRASGWIRGPGLVACWIALAAATVVALAVWQGHGYWEYSDGVYSLSARELLDGRSLYRDFAAAQPPSLFYLAAGVLALSDSPTSIRVAMALLEAATSLTVLVAVRRLTRWPAAALCAALICFLTPWALREHAQLLPETLAAPVVMAAALAGARRGAGSAIAGALGAAAATFKLAFVVPALAIALASRDVRRSLSGFTLAGANLTLVFFLIFGEPLFRNIVHAQAQTGQASLHYVSGLWLQAGWNALPLLLLAGLAWPRRGAIKDPDLARSLSAASLGSLLLLGTLLKHGSYLTVLVVAEPPLLCLAACGLALTLRPEPPLPQRTRPARTVAIAAGLVLALAQAASLIISPADPTLFTRPFAKAGPSRVLSSAEVQSITAGIRRCPASTVYTGPPYLAFVAGRGIAGSQPDQFMIRYAPVLARFRRAADTDPAICHGAQLPRPR